MDYNKIREVLSRGDDYLGALSGFTEDEREEFYRMRDRKLIRANRRKAIPLLRQISPDVRNMMAARVITTLDIFDTQAISYDESPRNLGWWFRVSPVLYRPQSLLNYPSYCEIYPHLVTHLEEKNARLPKEVSELIERTWGMYFGWAPFDHHEVAIGRDPENKGHYYHENMLRVLRDPNYTPHYEEGKIVVLSKWKVSNEWFQYLDRGLHFSSSIKNYLPIHPQTIQNIIGENGLVDILEIQSYDHGWPVARWRMEQVLKWMGMKVGKVMKVHFPNHGGDDAWFERGPNYAPSLLDESGNIVDILEWWKSPPLIIVQNDYGKGKFHDEAMWAIKSMWLMKERTVFKYVLARDEIGSDGWGGWWNIWDIELNMLTFEQIYLADMQKIALSMSRDQNKDSDAIVRALTSNYLEASHREKFELSKGVVIDEK